MCNRISTLKKQSKCIKTLLVKASDKLQSLYLCPNHVQASLTQSRHGYGKNRYNNMPWKKQWQRTKGWSGPADTSIQNRMKK